MSRTPIREPVPVIATWIPAYAGLSAPGIPDRIRNDVRHFHPFFARR